MGPWEQSEKRPCDVAPGPMNEDSIHPEMIKKNKNKKADYLPESRNTFISPVTLISVF